MGYIEITNLCKSYRDESGGEVPVLQDVSLSVEKGQFVSVFGPNGCGKSTLLNAIADLVPCDSGAIRIDGRASIKSRIGFVFQRYSESLFPWLRNLDNIGFGLDSRVKGKRKRRDHVSAFVAAMGLHELPLDKYPYQCSAGQQQLVALARELICGPDVLLMDEPFVSLDYDRRLAQQQYLLETLAKTKTTVLFVSHEIDEAIYLADRLLLMTRRPASVAREYTIPLPRPRRLEMLESTEFFALKTPVLHDFRGIIEK